SSRGFDTRRQVGHRAMGCLLKWGAVRFNLREIRTACPSGRLTRFPDSSIRVAMAPDRASGRLILVVDDDPDILQTLALCLSTEGYGVVMASNGQEALDVLGQQKPACILLDLMMPVMDG